MKNSKASRIKHWSVSCDLGLGKSNKKYQEIGLASKLKTALKTTPFRK